MIRREAHRRRWDLEWKSCRVWFLALMHLGGKVSDVPGIGHDKWVPIFLLAFVVWKGSNFRCVPNHPQIVLLWILLDLPVRFYLHRF